MATYYVRKTGSDANAGTSAGAAWLTIGKALSVAYGASEVVTVYVGAGTYRENSVISATNYASISMYGDVDGAQTGDAGEVIWTAYLTNDTSAPNANPTIRLNAKNNLLFGKMTVIGGNATASCIDPGTTLGTGITFQDMLFVCATANVRHFQLNAVANTTHNLVIQRCRFRGSSGVNVFVLPTSGSADYDPAITFQNNVCVGGSGIRIDASGALAFKGGGIKVYNNTFDITATCFQTNSANLSTSIPCLVYNNVMLTSSTALNANTSGQITEDWNSITAGTARTNVTAGTNSRTTISAMLEYGQASIVGRQLRPEYMPMAGSILLGVGAQAGGPSDDYFGIPRPAGGGSTSYAVGACERHSTAAQETSIVDAGSNGLKITGPGDQDLLIPVDATSTTITVRVRYDTNHGTGNKPQASLLANGQIGYAGETKTATAGVDTWETLTFSTFTPSAKGFVTLRLTSRAAAGNGIAYFDTVTGGANGSQGMDYFRIGEIMPAAVQTGAGSAGMLVHPGMTGGARG